ALEVLQQFARHAFRQFDQAVVVADVDAPDVAAFEPGLVGDGTDDIAWLYAMDTADLDTEGFQREIVPDTGARAGIATLRACVVVAERGFGIVDGAFLSRP